jgi:hypothetical protein
MMATVPKHGNNAENPGNLVFKSNQNTEYKIIVKPIRLNNSAMNTRRVASGGAKQRRLPSNNSHALVGNK